MGGIGGGERNNIVVNRVAGLAAAAVGVLGIALYSRYRHDIWIDEFVQFAFGAMSNTAEAWRVIVETIGSFNHNQTGVYMIVDFWLLKLFGASAFALRLPSLLSTIWLLVCATTFCGVRGLGNLWKLILIMALLAQLSLMNFAAEARPYMPLAAATVGTLTFYTAPMERRHGWFWAVGIVSIGVGTLMHPYFPVYWAAMICLGFVLAGIEGGVRFTFRDVTRFCDLRLVAAGLAVFGIVGALTWMGRGTALDLDPFQWVKRENFIVTMIDWTHLGFIFDFRTRPGAAANPRYVVLTLMLVSVLAYPLAARCWRPVILALLPPVALAFGALAISGFLSWISYRHHYWILERQWIASIALMPIAVVWYVAELGRRLDRLRGGASISLAVGCLVFLACSFVQIVPRKLSGIHDDLNKSPAARVSGSPGTEIEAPPRDPAGNDRWVALANANIAGGGPVWSVFRKFYGR